MKTRKEILQIALDACKDCKCTGQIFYFDGGFGRKRQIVPHLAEPPLLP